MARPRILISDDIPRGEMGTGRKGASLGNLGKVVTINPPTDIFGSRSLKNGQMLLSAGPEQLKSDAPGQWILNITSRVIWPNGLPVAGTYSSVTAKVTFGSGDASHSYYVDAWSNRLQVPSERVRVDVYFECLGNAPSFGPVQCFPVEVTCTLERANGFNPAFAPLKSFWILELGGAGPFTETIQIPPFATAYNFLPLNYTAAGTPPVSTMGTTVGSGDIVHPDVIESMARMNQFRALPSGAKELFLSDAIFPMQHPGRVQFQLNA